MSLPRGAVGKSVVFDCCNFWSFSLACCCFFFFFFFFGGGGGGVLVHFVWLYIFNEGHFLDVTKLACNNVTGNNTHGYKL